jgi:hypothetical protein
MNRPTIRTTAVLTAALALTAAACGDAGEEGIEQLIERETGEELELDLDGDGGISIETEEGAVRIDDEGNVVIEGEDGEVITGNVDAEDGSFTIEGEDGEVVTGNVDGEDGSFTFEGEDGDEFSMNTDEGQLPDDWPSEVPVPEGFEIVSGSSFTSGDDQFLSVFGEASDGSAWIAEYGAALESAGFVETSRFSADGDEFVTYEGNGWNVGVNASQADDGWQVSVNATALPG